MPKNSKCSLKVSIAFKINLETRPKVTNQIDCVQNRAKSSNMACNADQVGQTLRVTGSV